MKKRKVFWKKECIGYLLNGKVDNFDFYGDWISGENTKLLAEFNRKIEMEGEVYVCVGDETSGMIGNVVEIPDKFIGLRIRGRYDDGLDYIDDYKDLP